MGVILQRNRKGGGHAGHDIRGADRHRAGIGWGITVKTVDLHEKAQIDKVLEIANTISLKMMETIAEDIEDVAEPGPGEELLIQITY